jgi:sugar O-acyltransferase (sialic acid O-acetyltransferase NeuD family)
MGTHSWILGSGGHARSLLALAKSSVAPAQITTYISNELQASGPFKDLTYIPANTGLGGTDAGMSLINGIGVVKDTRLRTQVYSDALSAGFVRISLVSKSAFIEDGVDLGVGLQIFQNSVISSGCIIGNDVVVGTGAVIEHDTTVCDGSFIAPGALIMGGARVGPECSIFAGAIVLPGVRIGRRAVVGAGSVVLDDVPPLQVYAGNPASKIGEVDTND